MSASIPAVSARRRAAFAVLCAIGAAWVWHIHFWPQFHAACESQSLYFVQAVVDDGRPDLGGPAARHGGAPAGCVSRNGLDYISESPGLALLAVPLYAVAREIHAPVADRELWLFGYLACLLTVTLPLLLALRSLWRYLEGIGIEHHVAGWTILALALASPLFVYATLLFSNGLAAACVALTFCLLAVKGPVRARRLLGAGALVGFAGLADAPVFLLALLFAGFAAARIELPDPPSLLRQRLRAAALVLAGALPWLALHLASNAWLFGHPLRFAAQLRVLPENVQTRVGPPLHLPHLSDFMAQWFGERSGLLYHAPWLLLALAGLVLVARKHDTPRHVRIDALFLILAPLVYGILVASFGHWSLTDSASVRDLVPLLPLLAIGLAHFLTVRPWPPLLRALTAASILAGFLMALPIVATFPYHFHQLKQPVLEFSWPLVVLGYFSPSLGRILGWSDWLSLAVFTGLCALPWLIIGWPAGSEDVHRPKRWLRVLAAVALCFLWVTVLMASVGKNNRAREVAKYKASSLLGASATERDHKASRQRRMR